MNEWDNQTNIHPAAIVIIIIAASIIFFLSKDRIIWAFGIVSCFVSSAQKITVFQLDFNIIRIMILFSIIRFIIKPEKQKFIWHPLDKLIIYLALARILIYTLQVGNFGAFIYQLGASFDAFGIYFIFRKIFTSWKDIEASIQAFIFLSVPVSIFFIIEHSTGYNLFSVFGGVHEITMARQGRLRCQGAFSHPIIAGCFWAVLLPMMIALKNNSNKLKVFIITLPAIIIVITTASSTPISALAIGIVGGFLFIYRKKMKTIRKFLILILVLAHFSMKGSVWSLIAKINITAGSTSYYRYALLNGFITHIDEWWLLGTRNSSHWCWGCQDITNQYILEGMRGGLLSLVLFFIIIGVAFNSVGDTWRRVQDDNVKLALSWSAGVALLVHSANFIGVSYFGYIIMLWYFQLAMIASMDVFTKQSLLDTQMEMTKNDK